MPPERRLKLNFYQVLTLYLAIFKDHSFYLPMIAGCFTGGAMFCYISSSAAVLMDGYGLNQQQFSIAFGANAVGIMLASTLNKHLATSSSLMTRLKIGGTVQGTGALILVIAGLMSHVPIVVVFAGLFLAVAGIGFTGPNAMALAMSEQVPVPVQLAIMGSMQFSCGLIGGLMLNVLIWDALLNMGSVMLLFILIGVSAMYIMHRERKLKTA